MKAIIYARVSSAKQEDGASLDSQVEACRNFATANGCEILREVREVFSGAYLFDRPLLNECRELIRTGAVNALIVYDVDRLSRNVPHLGILLDECLRYNCELKFVQNDFENSPEGMLLFSIRGYLAEAERLKIIERVTRGRKTKAKQGTLSFKRKLYGYIIGANGKREIYEPEAVIVRQMFADYLDGKSLREIAAELNAENVSIPTGKNGIWWAYSVAHILKNPAYAGRTVIFRQVKKYVFRDGRRVLETKYTPEENHVELPADTTPALVSGADFQKAQEKFENNRKAKRSKPKREFLLRGLIKCKTCGRLMSPQMSYKWRSYVCTSKQNPTANCGVKLMAAKEAERLVWQEILKYLQNPNLLKSRVNKLRKQPKSEISGHLKTIDVQITKAEKELNNLIVRSAEVDDTLWESFKAQIGQKQKDLETSKAKRTELVKKGEHEKTAQIDLTNTNAVLRSFRRKADNLTFNEKVKILNELRISGIWDGENLQLKFRVQQYYGKSNFIRF